MHKRTSARARRHKPTDTQPHERTSFPAPAPPRPRRHARAAALRARNGVRARGLLRTQQRPRRCARPPAPGFPAAAPAEPVFPRQRRRAAAPPRPRAPPLRVRVRVCDRACACMSESIGGSGGEANSTKTLPAHKKCKWNLLVKEVTNGGMHSVTRNSLGFRC